MNLICQQIDGVDYCYLHNAHADVIQWVRSGEGHNRRAGGSLTLSYTKTAQKKTEQNANLTVSCFYDALGRLIRQTESGSVEKTYSYDLAGNRTGFVLKKGGVTEMNTAKPTTRARPQAIPTTALAG